MRRNINDVYFEWLYSLVSRGRYDGRISYRKLLAHLHNTVFRYSIRRDQNRAEDGMDLRYRFAILHEAEYAYNSIEEELTGACSVLEMMVALAIRCEENIMDDPHVGDRTAQWFWGMVNNLGLGSMYDNLYDRQYVNEVLDRFLDREYEPDGVGGLFTIERCDVDLRTVEIWYQLCWYLDTIT